MNLANHRPRRLFALFLAAFLLTASIGASSAISSPPPPAPQSATISATRAASGQAPQETITCDLTIDYPHKSTHVPATVNVVAHWVCTAPVASLSMDVQLYYGPSEVGTGHSANTESATLNGNAAASCSPGQWYGYVQGHVVFPPDYEPPSGDANAESNAYVTC